MTGQTIRAIWAALLSMAALAMTSPAAAHLTPNSEIVLTPNGDTVVADIIVPRGEYAYGTGNPVDRSSGSLAIAERYLRDHMNVRSPAGEDWNIVFQSVDFIQRQGPPDLHAVAVLAPPAGIKSTRFSVGWSVLIDDLPGHFALFLLANPAEPGSRSILGAVRRDSEPLLVEIAQPAMLQEFISAVQLGAHHIIEGYDHLIFLLALLLPAPLIVQGGHWRRRRPTGQTIWLLARIVTAFTSGHSLTLIGASLGGWQLPAAPVEVAIALSVLASAIHAWRPIMAGKEPLVALVFGLVHGLAFATLVQEAGTSMTSSLTNLLGFNIGIELVQLVIVAAVMPSLIMLARHEAYNWLRQALSGGCAFAAVAWIVNRTTGMADKLVELIESVLQTAALPAIALLAIAAIVLMIQRQRRRFPIVIVRRKTSR